VHIGRGGFVEVALRTGSPIIPISIVGSEEVHSNLAEIPALAKLLGLPYAPVIQAGVYRNLQRRQSVFALS
jgi:1-acyl-sn-glycerol-3-phosphate acyltransferase